MQDQIFTRAAKFSEYIGCKYPIFLGPMAGACPVELSIAVAQGGGMGACGALLMEPKSIKQWAAEFRSKTAGPFQLNLWIPDAPPLRNLQHESKVCHYLSAWGPEVSTDEVSGASPDFDAQCEALLEIEPPVISSIMGLFDSQYVALMKSKGIKWFASVSTVSEAVAAEAAGADVIVAKSYEAGGHSAAFLPQDAMRFGVGSLSLVPAIADAVNLPIVATGGIADGRTAAAAFLLGASAVQMGTGFLRATESTIAPAWSDAISKASPEETMVTRAYSGRAGRCIANKFAMGMEEDGSPEPAPYPLQRGYTQAMRNDATKNNRIDTMQAWAGQSAKLAKATSAVDITESLWRDVNACLGR